MKAPISQISVPQKKRLHAGKALLATLLVIAAIGGVGYCAYKLLFKRPGEAAIAWIPADADFVMTLDTNPSERQLDTFRIIGDKLKEHGLIQKLDSFLSEVMRDVPVAQKLRPYVAGSYAFAAWTPDSGNGSFKGLALVALDNAGGADSTIRESGSANADGVVKFSDQVFVKVIDPYLIIASDESLIQKVEGVRDGKSASLVKDAGFIAARKSLPVDTNLMYFIDGRSFQSVISEMNGQKPAQTGMLDWMAYGFTVEPDGLRMDGHAPLPKGQMPEIEAIMDASPIDKEAINTLPKGAFGVLAISEPVHYWNWTKAFAKKDPSLAEFEKGLSEFETQTGLNIEKDIQPALEGDVVLAVYPDFANPDNSFDVILAMTYKNKNNPAAGFEKIRTAIAKASADSNHPAVFKETTIGEARVWSADLPSDPNNPNDPAQGKAIVMAEAGDRVYITSSVAMLNRALSARKTGETLANDPAYVNMNQQLLGDYQFMMMVDLRRILETFRNKIEPTMKESPFVFDDLTALLGNGSKGIVCAGGVKFEASAFTMFVPLDWGKIVDFIGKSAKEAPESQEPPKLGLNPYHSEWSPLAAALRTQPMGNLAAR